jgi:hypothetical protein
MESQGDNEVESTPSRGGSLECKPLLGLATQEICRKNSFRITGLPVDATAREISKHTDRLKQMTELGITTGANKGPLALSPPPTADDIREAHQNLNDPERRILDEFFWFWPEEFGRSQTDPAIQAVVAGDCDTALRIWAAKETNPSDGVVAMHNIAVFWQLKALDAETSPEFDPLAGDSLKLIEKYWNDALKRWNYLSTDDVLWDKVSGRVRQTAEARLTTGFVRRMRTTLPAAFRKVHAQLALHYAQSGARDLAKMHIRFMRGEDNDVAGSDATVDLILAPTTTRVREHTRSAKLAADAAPEKADRGAREMIDLALPLMDTFDLFYGEAPHPAKDLLDEIAATCLSCIVAYQRATDDNRTFVELLERALPLAESPEVRKPIQDNIQIGKKNLAHAKFYGNLTPISSAPSLSTINGIGLTLYGCTDKDPATGSYLATYYFVFIAVPIFPICRYRVIPTGNGYRFFGKAPLRPFDKCHLAISVGLIIWLIVAINSTSNAPSTGSYTPSAPASVPSTPQPVYAPPANPARTFTPPSPSTYTPSSTDPGATYHVPHSRSYELENDRTAIETQRSRAKQLEDNVEALSRDLDNARRLLDRTSQYDIDQYNAKVRYYNEQMAAAKAAVNTLNTLVEAYNSKLERYSH